MDNIEKIWERLNQGVFTIAEIGKNFIQEEEVLDTKTYLGRAKKLILAAKQAGADSVKFQTHNVEDEQMAIDVTSPHFTGSDRYNWVKRNTKATPLEFWRELKQFCDEQGIIFFSTPMSRGAAEILEKVGVELWKVGSGDILDFVLLDYLGQTGKPIIISSGMSTLEEIDKAVNFLKARTDKIILMHCVSQYPCPPEDLNLGTIDFFKKRYQLPIGFSDHSTTIDSAVAAANLGAAAIEKHFTFNRSFWGSDHKVSILPEEFKKMVEMIKTKFKVKTDNYGQTAKVLQAGEKKFRPLFRKSLVAGRKIKAGTALKPAMIYAMRPQIYIKGLPSEEYEKVLGKKPKRGLEKYQPITYDVLE